MSDGRDSGGEVKGEAKGEDGCFDLLDKVQVIIPPRRADRVLKTTIRRYCSSATSDNSRVLERTVVHQYQSRWQVEPPSMCGCTRGPDAQHRQW